MAEETKVNETADTAEAEPQKSVKKKKDKKAEEIEALKKQLEEEHNLLLRTAAEFDNYKKRTEREKLSIGEYAKAGVIKNLLPVFDNIERASAVEPSSAEYIKGIELIVKQLVGLSEKIGIEPLANVGDVFNPTLHEAVMHIEDETLGENTVAEVLQQGYKIGDTVIRAAMVKVAN